jgi:hypothetical protein
MGLFEDPTNVDSVGQIEVIYCLTYLLAPFWMGCCGPHDPQQTLWDCGRPHHWPPSCESGDSCRSPWCGFVHSPSFQPSKSSIPLLPLALCPTLAAPLRHLQWTTLSLRPGLHTASCPTLQRWFFDPNLVLPEASSSFLDSWLHPTLPKTNHHQEVAPRSQRTLFHVSLPGYRGLFSKLQLALKDKSCICLDCSVYDALANFQWLKDNLDSRPTQLLELVELPHRSPVLTTLRSTAWAASSSNSKITHPLSLACPLSQKVRCPFGFPSKSFQWPVHGWLWAYHPIFLTYLECPTQ